MEGFDVVHPQALRKASKPAPDESADANAGERGERCYLEFVAGSSAKFYAVVLSPADDGDWAVAFNFGRLGTPRSWDYKLQDVDHETARQAFDDLIEEKERKGYERQPWPGSLDMPDGAAGSRAGGAGEPSSPRTPTIFLSDRRGELPSPTGGEVAGVRLPPGRLFHPESGGGSRGAGSVLWISFDPVPDLSRTWSTLSASFAGTGLWPLVVEADRGLDPFDEILIDVPRSKRADVSTIL